MYTDITRLISHWIDKDTLCRLEAYGRNSKLGLNLVGDSIFTTAIQHKCDKLGIKTRTTPEFWDLPFVVDDEMENPPRVPRTEKAMDNDIDHVYWSDKTDMSANAAAALSVITDLSEFKNCIVAVCGRGHGVKGLARSLIVNDYTVTQCHAYTKDIKYAIHTADVVVWAQQDWPFIAGAFPVRTRLIIDISYQVPKAFLPDKVVHVGNIATSILINRAMSTCFAAKPNR